MSFGIVTIREIVKNVKIEQLLMGIQSLSLPESKRKALEEFVREVRKRYGDRVRRIILFGSVARGDFHKESDIDVLVIADGVKLKEVSSITTKILLKYGEVISPVVRTEKEFQERRTFMFNRTVLEEGVELA